MDNYFSTEGVFWIRGVTLWYIGESPLYLSAIDIERIEKHYEEDEPKRPWRVTASSIDKNSIRFLQDFPTGCKLLVTHQTQGRRDIFDSEDVIGKLTDCRPEHAWMDNLVAREIDGLLTYNLLIACEFELFPSKEEKTDV